jgi:hypothetical protein
LFVAAGAILGDRLLDRVQQILISNRFGQELYRAALHGPNRHWKSAWPLMKRIGTRRLALARSS